MPLAEDDASDALFAFASALADGLKVHAAGGTPIGTFHLATHLATPPATRAGTLDPVAVLAEDGLVYVPSDAFLAVVFDGRGVLHETAAEHAARLGASGSLAPNRTHVPLAPDVHAYLVETLRREGSVAVSGLGTLTLRERRLVDLGDRTPQPWVIAFTRSLSFSGHWL